MGLNLKDYNYFTYNPPYVFLETLLYNCLGILLIVAHSYSNVCQ